MADVYAQRISASAANDICAANQCCQGRIGGGRPLVRSATLGWLIYDNINITYRDVSARMGRTFAAGVQFYGGFHSDGVHLTLI